MSGILFFIFASCHPLKTFFFFYLGHKIHDKWVMTHWPLDDKNCIQKGQRWISQARWRTSIELLWNSWRDLNQRFNTMKALYIRTYILCIFHGVHICLYPPMAEFRSVVKDTKSNTKYFTKSISIHSDYQSVHFLVSAFVSPFHHHGRFGHQSCYELQKTSRTLLILAGITFCK